MVVKGRVQNGVVVLPAGAGFAEGEEVTVVANEVARRGKHSVMDIPVVSLGSVVCPLTANDDILGEMLEGRK